MLKKGFFVAWKVSGVLEKDFSVVSKAFLMIRKVLFVALKVGEIELAIRRHPVAIPARRDTDRIASRHHIFLTREAGVSIKPGA